MSLTHWLQQSVIITPQFGIQQQTVSASKELKLQVEWQVLVLVLFCCDQNNQGLEEILLLLSITPCCDWWVKKEQTCQLQMGLGNWVRIKNGAIYWKLCSMMITYIKLVKIRALCSLLYSSILILKTDFGWGNCLCLLSHTDWTASNTTLTPWKEWDVLGDTNNKFNNMPF